MADEIGLDYEAVMRARREEKRSKLLQKLEPHDFFTQFRRTVDVYSRETEAARKSGDTERMTLLHNDLKTIRMRVGEIYALRERKIAMLAVLEAEGGSPDISCISREEMPVYEALLAVMRDGRARILEGKDAPEPPTRIPPPEQEHPTGRGEAPPKTDEDAQESGDEGETTIENMETPEPSEMMTLLAIDDLPPFSGYHRDYHIRKGDIFTVTRKRGEILLRTGKVAGVGAQT